jgi:predicted Rossmann fold nucleotide-binding protein DprA/Smf involved in DNA uptake
VLLAPGKILSMAKIFVRSLLPVLRGKNVSIVSGLALGIDTIAHKAALAAGLHTLAVPGSGIGPDVLYPHSNRKFAKDIELKQVVAYYPNLNRTLSQLPGPFQCETELWPLFPKLSL